MTAIGLDFLLKSMELNKELSQGIVIALKANYLIVKIKYNKSFLSTKNKAIINITVHANIDIVLKGVVSAPQT